jgi:hypothetical protein
MARRSAASLEALRASGSSSKINSRSSRLFDNTTRGIFYEQQLTAGGHTISMTLGWHIGINNGVRFFYKQLQNLPKHQVTEGEEHDASCVGRQTSILRIPSQTASHPSL